MNEHSDETNRKKYLLTGATGFLGSIIYDELKKKNELITLGRSTKNSIQSDLKQEVPKLLQEIDVVVHNAGKAHSVSKTEEEAQDFYSVNLEGTNASPFFDEWKNGFEKYFE